MRDDYTFEGVPIRDVPTEQIEACLRDGIYIVDGSLHPEVTVKDVLHRLEIELTIRKIRDEG